MEKKYKLDLEKKMKFETSHLIAIGWDEISYRIYNC